MKRKLQSITNALIPASAVILLLIIWQVLCLAGGTSGIYASVAVAGGSGICKGFSIDGGAYVDHAF